ncbi:MAP1LC3C [Bugula neritina]|uniref:MAP1LC3C n=1 Tax=Bugula neritina TaxID=10212 RepID=A0A7J7IU70_BUGNE|nr:MAP1LC3C [Bugula neritina]
MSASLFIGSRKMTHKHFKERVPAALRRKEAQEIRLANPGKLPMIVEKHKKERNFKRLAKCKFLVPHEMTISQLMQLLRSVP